MRNYVSRLLLGFGLSLLTACDRSRPGQLSSETATKKHHLRVDITGVSGIFPSAKGEKAKRTVVFPDARMPQRAKSPGLDPEDPGYIIPAHFVFVRIPMRNVASSSRPPDFIFYSDIIEYLGDFETVPASAGMPQRVPNGQKAIQIGIWLLGLKNPEKVTLPAHLIPVKLQPDLTNVAIMSEICFNPYVAQRFLEPAAEHHVRVIFDLPEAYLTKGFVNTAKTWRFEPPLETSEIGKQPKPHPLAQTVYSEWEMKDTVALNITSLKRPVTAGTTPGTISAPTPFIVLKAAGSDVVIRIGDAPLEDILELPMLYKESIDTHFELYYLLTNTDVETIDGVTSTSHPGEVHVPVLVDGLKYFYVPNGHNCPTLLFEGAVAKTSVPRDIAQRHRSSTRVTPK